MIRPEPGQWEIVIRLGRKFDVQIAGSWSLNMPEIRIPFDTRSAALAAKDEIRISVEGNPVLAGQVEPDQPQIEGTWIP